MIVNGGTDMLMINGGKLAIDRILKHAKSAINKKFILQRRLDESVVRILSVKMAMGLIKGSNSAEETTEQQVTPQVPETSTGN